MDSKYKFKFHIRVKGRTDRLEIYKYFENCRCIGEDSNIRLRAICFIFENDDFTTIGSEFTCNDLYDIYRLNEIINGFPVDSKVDFFLSMNMNDDEFEIILSAFHGNFNIDRLTIYSPSNNENKITSKSLKAFKELVLKSAIEQIYINDIFLPEYNRYFGDLIKTFIKENPVDTRSIPLKTKVGVKSAAKKEQID